MQILQRAIVGMNLPAVEKISDAQAEDPFRILVATALSARTQDATTHAASTRLFKRARTPRTLAKLPVEEIEELIYPVGFYRTKARMVKACCQALVERFDGQVPSTMEELVSLPGVGRKTANLVLILAFRSQRNICVDTHVHRISNRLGWVETATPERTEQALYEVAPARWWSSINLYLVTWGQNICRPVHPRCGDCALAAECPRIGVIGGAVKRRAILMWAGAALLSSAAVSAAQAPAAQTAKPAAPAAAKAATPVTPKSPGAGPVLVVETDKGVFEIETYPTEAPKTVEHILALVKRNFYNGQRVHRHEPGFVVQFGDQQTRDMTKRANWGTGGSGKPIGVGEMNPKRTHRLGAVAMAHQPDDPGSADSQMYIVLGESRARTLNGKYTVFGQVISGMPVVQKLTVLSMIKRVSVRLEAPSSLTVKPAK